MLLYQSECLDFTQHVNKTDCMNNGKLWPEQKTRLTSRDKDRLTTLAFTKRIVDTLDLEGWRRHWQRRVALDAFTRKATIAIGTGYVHESLIDDLTNP